MLCFVVLNYILVGWTWGFDTLVKNIHCNKMASERWACSGFQDQRVHFKVENTPIRLTNGKRKFKRMLFFLFLDKLKLFFAKLSFQEFNLVFFKAEHLAYFSMPSGQWSIWRNFRYILYSMVKENTFIEGFFCIY